MRRLIGFGAAITLLLAALGGNVAGAQAATVSADATTYFVGDTAAVSVTGLTECAGESVRIGFFGSDGEEGQTATATVSENGSATGTFEVTSGGFSVFAGVSGDCVEGGLLVDDTQITLFEFDPTAEPERSVTTDQASYLTGETAIVTITGLTECVGESVRVGFFGQDGEESVATTVAVSDLGGATASIPITTGGFGAYPGAAGECIEGGFYISDTEVSLLYDDPTQEPTTQTPTPSSGSSTATPTRIAPNPPETGTGVADGGSDSLLPITLAGLALVIGGAGVLVAIRRHT